MLTQGKLSGVRVIGFDLDQTLFPKAPEIDHKIQEYICERIAAEKGVGIAEAGRLFEERYRGGAGMTGNEALADLGLPNPVAIVQEALERSDISSLLTPDPATLALVRDLRHSYESVDLITGSGRTQTEKKLAALGFEHTDFDHFITADDASKSTGESYRLWLSFYPALLPPQFLYIGDRPRSDHEVPAALGIQTALVYVTEPDEKLSCLQCTSLADIRPHLL